MPDSGMCWTMEDVYGMACDALLEFAADLIRGG